ncbi:MAG: hypothetical protein WB729_17060 [Candidatus Sulfotelmatobacter sp.]
MWESFSAGSELMLWKPTVRFAQFSLAATTLNRAIGMDDLLCDPLIVGDRST